ncbi:MAG: hypothetical protein QOI10_2868 [Solirubrobacterales bacterium]|jgi:DUF4097 and DUF4098 domain-containing protein YvlB|nr:hypothetical protein [Solirubrobacterales bacterium]
MRRTAGAVLALGLVAGLMVPAALAGTKIYEGTVGDSNGVVHFTVHTRHGNSKLSRFQFDQLDLACSQGIAHIQGNFPDTVKLKNGNFKLSNDPPHGAYTEVATGKVAGKQASGTLQVSGDFEPGSLDDCDSGIVHWTASR